MIENRLFNLVCKIPAGKVATYGQIARALGINPRTVGKILSKNSDPSIPCHRVVMSDGRVGGFNRGLGKKIELLRSEGVEVDRKRINLKRFCTHRLAKEN
jgi:methylated-DNA-[protein]-cysteine S-methyltransferase